MRSPEDLLDVRTRRAWRALAEVLVSEALEPSYEPRLTALREAHKWLAIDATCGDCQDGRCHWGSAKPDGPCGCARHAFSVQVREWDEMYSEREPIERRLPDE